MTLSNNVHYMHVCCNKLWCGCSGDCERILPEDGSQGPDVPLALHPEAIVELGSHPVGAHVLHGLVQLLQAAATYTCT